jgi:hypothetical protein
MTSTLAHDQTTARSIPVPETVHRNPVETEIGVDTRTKTRTGPRTGTAITVPHHDVPLDQVPRRSVLKGTTSHAAKAIAMIDAVGSKEKGYREMTTTTTRHTLASGRLLCHQGRGRSRNSSVEEGKLWKSRRRSRARSRKSKYRPGHIKLTEDVPVTHAIPSPSMSPRFPHLGITTLRPRRDLLCSLNRLPSLPSMPFRDNLGLAIDELVLSFFFPPDCLFLRSKVYYHERYPFYDTVTILLSALHIHHSTRPLHHLSLSHLTLPLWFLALLSRSCLFAFGPFNLVFLIATYYKCTPSDSH